MKRKIFGSMLALALATVALSVALLSVVLYGQLAEDMRRELHNQAAYVTAGYDAGDLEYLASIRGTDPGSRITLVDRDGTVLFDNRVDIAAMDNHRDRPEIADAFADGKGESVRVSDSVGKQSFYVAVRLTDGRVLRVSGTSDTMLAAFLGSRGMIVLALLLVAVLSVLAARLLTRRIVAPINAIDPERPVDHPSYEELAPLLVKIRHLHASLDEQVRDSAERTRHFNEITEHMEEGLVILDEHGRVVSANRSALRFLGAENDRRDERGGSRGGEQREGAHYSTLNRSMALRDAVEAALSGEPREESVQAGGRSFQLRSTPVRTLGKNSGAILLLLDITEKQKAEIQRREFTANVSHELKTPLTAILGYAELLRDGIAKGGDALDFAGRIHDEAKGLIALVEDVIRLSQLDEKSLPLPTAALDLYAAATAVAERLAPMARSAGVELGIEGTTALIRGVPHLIDELLLNLCDNGIKYNRSGGRVILRVEAAAEVVRLTVEDTGIGIPPEHQERIFERFYRVDQSHSRATGGTGLGLSIVKHIAAYHKASIELASRPGEGTRITVTFPHAE